MREMEEDDDENYQKHFAKYIFLDLEADDLEELFEKVHAAIREDPTRAELVKFTSINNSFKKDVKKSYDQRKVDSNAKKTSYAAGGDEDEDE